MPTEQPNVLLVTSDQQHYATLGALTPELETPNLDRLAAEGTRFDRAYCPNPTCTPTRGSIITGKPPSQHGGWSLGTKVREDQQFVGDVFEANGYETALIGKGHLQPTDSTEAFPSIEARPTLQDLDFWRDFHGPYYGFDHIELHRNHVDESLVGQHYAVWMEDQGFTDWRDHFREPTGNRDAQSGTWSLPEEYHYNRWMSERITDRIDRYAGDDDPFFLWASFADPHPQYLVPEPWDDMYDPADVTVPSKEPGEHDANPPHFQLTQEADPDFSAYRETGQSLHGLSSHLHDRERLAQNIAIYYGMISFLDDAIGDILDHLDDRGLTDDTLVVFTSDHGHFYGHHGLITKGPFHYEDLIRVPFLARHPGEIPAGRSTDALQSLTDLAPTFLSWCDIQPPREMVGVDQGPVWQGTNEWARDHVVVENRHEPTTLHLKTYVDERYKLTRYYQQDYGELFDLATDPGETNNLWNEPGATDLKHELTRDLLFAEMGTEPLWMPRISGA